uniref:Spindle assembly abnormal protein 6 homolog n=1 Tax=Lepisosteus oculatus TaxID=7918 RepID=W5MW30_LEPOC|nr:PREDICTED: spindle assembly abnormal protein 6 homolog isoform X2 [Lepisosteus oculatus]
MTMAEELFCKVVNLIIKCKDCEDRRASIRLTVEAWSASSPLHKKDLVIRLTDDSDPFFLYNLTISEDDFQSLKCQQGLLIEFSAFPQRFIELIEQCILEQVKEIPRFLLQLEVSSSAIDRHPSALNVIETNPFKHLIHLSLRMLPGNDADVKKYLAVCLQRLKTEKNNLEEKLKQTEDDLSKRLSVTQQTLAEKAKELEKMQNTWSLQTSELSNRHNQDVTAERERALQIQSHCQQQHEHQKREMELAHKRAVQHLESRTAELECINKELMEKKYKSESAVRELRAKLANLEDDYQRSKQELISLRRENSTLDTECHEKEKLLNHLRTRTAVLEQEIKDKEQVVTRTTNIFEAAKEKKKRLEETMEEKHLLIGKLEATVKSLSEELLKANEIIRKLQMDVKKLVEKTKLKNTVTMQQEKLLGEKEQSLQKERQELTLLKHAVKQKEEEVSKLQDQLDATVQKLDESTELLKTNENVISWLNKQLNESKIASMQGPAGLCEPAFLASKTTVMQNNLQQLQAVYSSPLPDSLMHPLVPAAQPTDKYSKICATLPGLQTPSLGLSIIRNGPQVHFSPLPAPGPTAAISGPATSTPIIPQVSSNDAPGLDVKYLQKSAPVKALKSLITGPNKPLVTNRGKPQAISSYFPGQRSTLPAS